MPCMPDSCIKTCSLCLCPVLLIQAFWQASSGETGLKLQTLGGQLLTVDIVNNRLTILSNTSTVSAQAPLESCRSIVYPVDALLGV